MSTSVSPSCSSNHSMASSKLELSGSEKKFKSNRDEKVVRISSGVIGKAGKVRVK